MVNYRFLGSSGLKITELVYGNWITHGLQVENDTATRCVHAALDAGITSFDTADAYANGVAEEVLGAALKGQRRESLEVFTKVYWPTGPGGPNDTGLSRKHIMESIDRSLDRLGFDYLDVYFAHRYDPETPLEETVEAFSDVVRSGRAHYWGTSMWSPAQIAEAHTFAKANGLVAPITEQPEYSMLRRSRVEERVLPVTTRLGLGLVVWSPLAQGLLTGKYDDGVPEGSRFANFERFREQLLTEENAAKVRALRPIADELGVTRAQLALAWVLRQPGVSSVITGATRVEQLEENVRAATLELSPEQLERIDEVLG